MKQIKNFFLKDGSPTLIIIIVYTGSIKNVVSQYRFHEHYGQQSHNGIEDWQLTLIEQCETHDQLKTFQLTSTCLRSTVEALEKVVKYVQNQQ